MSVKVFFGILFISQLSATNSNSISGALANIVDSLFAKEKSVFNFFIECKNVTEREYYFSDIFESTLERLDSVPVLLGVHQELPPDDTTGPYYILAVDSVNSLKLVYNSDRHNRRHFKKESYVLIVLRTFGAYYYDELLCILEKNWELGVVKVNVIVEPLPGLILMYIYLPYTEYGCAAVAPVIMNRYNDSKWTTESFFPLRMNNLHGCQFSCITWNDDPHVRLLSTDRVTGIVGELFGFLTEQLNFTIKCDVFDDHFGTYLLFQNADLILAATRYRSTEERGNYLQTPAYGFVHMFLVMSSERDRISSFQIFLSPLQGNVWLTVALFFATGVLVSISLRFFKPNQRDFIIGRMNTVPIYNMFVTALGGGVHRLPTRNFSRFLLCIWIILCFILQTGYQSGLFNSIRSGLFVPLPNSVEEVTRQGYNIVIHLPVVPDQLENYKHRSGLDILDMEFFPLLAKMRKVAILTLHTYFYRFIELHKAMSDDFHVVREEVINIPVTVFLRLDTGLSQELIWKIGQYNDYGFAGKSMDPINAREEFIVPIKSMTLEDLMEPLYLFLIGCALSLVVFGLEIMTHNFSVRLHGPVY